MEAPTQPSREGSMNSAEQPVEPPIEYQVATGLVALAAALCKQPGVDGQKLRMDFLDIVEGIARNPAGVGIVAMRVASVMDTTLRSDGPRNG